jgi:hypothetical protein
MGATFINSAINFINKPFKTFFVRGMQIDTVYWQVFAIIFLIFLMLLTLARMRYLYVHWSTGQSAIAFMFWGAILTVIFEGFFLIGGRTLFTELMGWKDAPKPISAFLDIGRSRLIEKLDLKDGQIPESFASENPTSKKVITDYERLSEEEMFTVEKYVCRE